MGVTMNLSREKVNMCYRVGRANSAYSIPG